MLARSKVQLAVGVISPRENLRMGPVWNANEGVIMPFGSVSMAMVGRVSETDVRLRSPRHKSLPC